MLFLCSLVVDDDDCVTVSAGQSGPLSPELNKPSPTAAKKAEEIGQYLFHSESFEEWSSLFSVNTFSVYFMTVAFLELLDKGSQDKPGFTSNVINITSISGLMKVAQRHVRKTFLSLAGLADAIIM